MTTDQNIQLFIGILGFIGTIGGWSVWANFIRNKEKKEREIEEIVEDKIEEIMENEANESKTEQIEDYYLINSNKTRILLTQHPIFSHLQDMDIYFSLHFNLPDKGRELLVKEKVIPKIRVWYKTLYKMAEQVQNCTDVCPNKGTRACGNSYNICRNAFIKGVEEYRNYHIKRPVSLDGKPYTNEDFETMNIYSEKFNHYHAPSEIMTSDMLNEVFNSIVYQDCYSRVWDFLTACSFAFARVKVDSGTAIKNLNGELTGREFLGVIVGDFDYDEYN